MKKGPLSACAFLPQVQLSEIKSTVQIRIGYLKITGLRKGFRSHNMQYSDDEGAPDERVPLHLI
jgi:hypothetical protein